MENDRIKNSSRNVFYGFLKYLISIVLPFVMRTILIYKLGSEYAGISSLFSSILQVLSLSELGFSTAVVFSLYEPVADGDNEKICALLSFFRKVYKFCGLFILIGGLIVTPFIKHLISGTYPDDINLYIIFILLLINTSISYLFCGYISVLFSANQRDDILSKSTILANIILYTIQALALLCFSNYYLYICGMLAGTITNNLLMRKYAKKMYPDIYCHGSIGADERNKLIRKVGTLFGHQLDSVVVESADNIVISMFLGLNILAIYNNYYYIVRSLLVIIVTIANSFAGSIGNSIATETKEKNFKNFIDFTYLIGLLNSICTILMLVLYQDFMKIWMGEAMLLDLGVVFCLCISFYVRQFRKSVVTYKIAAGVWESDALKPYIAAITNLVVNIILVQKIGLYGVIISTILTMALVEAPWEIAVLFKDYFGNGLKKYLMIQFKITFKMIIIGIVVYNISSILPSTDIILFLVKAVILGLLTVLLFSLLSFKDNEFKYITGQLKKILKVK